MIVLPPRYLGNVQLKARHNFLLGGSAAFHDSCLDPSTSGLMQCMDQGSSTEKDVGENYFFVRRFLMVGLSGVEELRLFNPPFAINTL